MWGVAHGMEYLITGIVVLIGGFVVYWGSFSLLFVIMGAIQLIARSIRLRFCVWR